MKQSKAILLRTLIFVLALTLLESCGQQTTNAVEVQTSLSKEIKEVRPGILEGYLAMEEMPNSLLLLPPPPEEGSAAWELDMETAALYVAMEDEERKALADAGLSTYAAKDHYQRERPFMINGKPTCTPEEEEYLSQDGSYPSGHTAIGWAWALILTELFPDQADVILKRGKEFGISRNVCNLHWHSDVAAGRLMGAAAVARLHANADFLIDMEAAVAEIQSLRNQ